ncbi:hypothetical protein Tsubulata_006696, partial [Turnera subulata]
TTQNPYTVTLHPFSIVLAALKVQKSVQATETEIITMASTPEREEPSPSIYIPEEWSDAAEAIAFDSTTPSPPIALVCGAKNCGKTTFSRHLLNIQEGGLFGYGCWAARVYHSRFLVPHSGRHSNSRLDDSMPKNTGKRDPSAYLKYIFTLYDYYRKEYCMTNNSKSPLKTELPLVVNTPGWVKGVGYDILADMLRHIAPTHDDHDVNVNLIEINSARQDSFKRSILVQKDARLLRDSRIIAYFRQCFPSYLEFKTIKELANALASHTPYEVPVLSIKIRHLHCQVPDSEIFYSLNATIVGLAVSSEQSTNFPWSVGLGIVRGIDTFKRVLYIITPVPPSILEKVDLLLQGFIQIPTCLLQVQGCISPYMSSNVLPTS